MAIQASRLNDDRYLHWLRSSLSLLYLKEGITSFCHEKGGKFHNDIRDRVRLKSPFAIAKTCSRCSSKNAVRTKTQDKKSTTWRMDCRCNVCNIWLEETLPYHKNYPCPNIAWSNTDPKLWPTDAWELCKLFLPFGSESQRGPGDSDCQALLILMMDCKYFHTFLTNTQLLHDINQVRNACMHSKDMRVDEAEMRRGLGLMISLLEQPPLATRPDCVEAKTKIIELRDNLLDISLNKELELQALNIKIAAIRSDVDRLEAELQQLQSSLSDVMVQQNTTADEYRQMCERVIQLGQNITEMKTSLEQISQTIDPSIGTKMADLTSRLQELETNSSKEIERLENSFQSTIAGIETRLGNLETQRVAPDQPVDIKGLQRQLISLYEAQRQHIPVYLLRSERKIRLEDIYVEQRLRVVDPDGRLKTDSAISHSRHQSRSESLFWTDPHGRTKADKNEKFISSLRDVFYSEGNKCQYVYVSGNAGYGKSVFCNHLVRLWCKAHSENITALTQDEELMAEFPLIFYVDLRDAKYDRTDQTPDEVCSLIQKQLQLSQLGLTDNDLSKLLQAEGQVLVVMDALDECKEERLPSGGLYNKCTTLVTSRPWKLEALRCDPGCRVDKELEIVGLKKGSPEDLSEKLVKLLNKKWNKSKHSRDFIWQMREEGLEEFFSVPVMLTSMLCLWHDDVPFGQSRCEIYKTSIHHQILAAVKAKDIPDYTCSSDVPFPICQREKCPCKRYGELLWKVSELACKALLGNVRERSLVMDHDQTEFLGLTDKEVAISMKLGILTQYKLLGNVTDYEPQKSVSFTHKTYQEWFAAAYLILQLPVPELEKLLSEGIVDLDSALELDQMFLFVCGQNAEVAAKLSEFIMSKVSSDTRVQKYRRCKYSGQLIRTIQDVIVAGAVEAQKNSKEAKALQLHDVYISSWYNERFSSEHTLACDTSHARSVCIISSVYIQESGEEESKVTPWPASSCIGKLELCDITNALDETFCDNFSAASLVYLYLYKVTLPHDQLESMCQSLASAGSLRTVDIIQLTCITHRNSRQDCSIMLDLSQHQGLEELTLRNLGVGGVQGVSLCHNMDKLQLVVLNNVTLTHDQLESLCQSLASAGSLRTVRIYKLTCITHKDKTHECFIHMDFCQYVSFEKKCKSWRDHPNINITSWRDRPLIKITSWPSSSSMETVYLRRVDISSCDTFCDNFNVDKVSIMYLENVTLTHDQLESLCQSLASAGSLRKVNIIKLTCITHKDKIHECFIHMDLCQYVSFEENCQSWCYRPDIKITSWPSSSCMETVDLRRVDISQCDTFCDNFNVDQVSSMYLENVTLTHDQLESLCQSLASAVSLRTVDITKLTCITHKDNRQDCSIMLDLSQHQGLEELILLDLGVGEVRGVSLCKNMYRLRQVKLGGFCISATALRQTLESLPGHCVWVELGDYYDTPLRVRGVEEARQLLEEIRRASHTHVYEDDVEYTGDECVVKKFFV